MASSRNGNQPPTADAGNNEPQGVVVAGKRGFYPRPMGKQQPNGKPQAPAAANPNRKALGDIGNVVNVRPTNGKPPVAVPVARPVTRGFGAQLLQNARQGADEVVAAAAASSKQKLQVGHSPDGDSTAAKENNGSCVPMSTGSSTKKSKNGRRRGHHSLTSVLSARSKMACGLTYKRRERVPNIDGGDMENELAVVEYVEDIYSFYKIAEVSGRPGDYMASQPEINIRMRAILADWLMEVHHKFELMPETLYLGLHIVDQYLSKVSVRRRELQLVGICAMLIACKYEEIWAPEVDDFICISDRAYDRDQILGMEKIILNCLEWNLTVPTPYVFLVRFIKAAAADPAAATPAASAAVVPDREMEHMVYFLAELGLMQYSAAISYSPSLFAAAAVYVARHTLARNPAWTVALRHHTGYSEDQLLGCARLLVECHTAAPQGKLKVAFGKYSSSSRLAVALKPPAMWI